MPVKYLGWRLSNSMTTRQLMVLRDLKKKIKIYQERLTELQASAKVKSHIITGAPLPKGISDKIGHSVIKIMHTKDILLKLCEKLTNYIENIDDPVIRMILTCRYINDLSWQKTAFKIGNENKANSLKKRLYRYFKKQK